LVVFAVEEKGKAVLGHEESRCVSAARRGGIRIQCLASSYRVSTALTMLAQRVLSNPAFTRFNRITIRGESSSCERANIRGEHKHGELSKKFVRGGDSLRSYSRSCAKYIATPASRAQIGGTKASSVASEAIGVTESGNFTISDSALQQRGFELYFTVEHLDLDQLNTLFVKVGFPRRHREKLSRALEHTLSMVWLKDVKAEQLIAFARATGDDVFNAIIWDVVVDPSYQGCGLGKVVIERLMADLVRKGISNIALYAEPNVVGFYKPLGFIADPDGIRAMAYSRRRR
jgi:ribosomal protein S18 acetylase RimI-like enzyme